MDQSSIIKETDLSYQFEDIESVTLDGEFEDEYVYDIEVDDGSHTFIANDILVHNSVYLALGGLFKCMTPEYQKLYDTDRKKIDWLVRFSKEFIDKQNKEWLDAMYNPRGGQNVHEFELETISKAAIFLKKKKYLKALSFVKGKYYDKPKISGTGIEIIKSTTPKLCREMLKQLTEDLLFNAGTMTKDEYIFYFNNLLSEKKKEFYNAPIEDISQSVGVGAYKKYVIDDSSDLVFAKKCPVSVKAIARYNYLAARNGDGDKRITGGKIKYYNIRLENGEGDYFGFPAGELPRWAPKMDKTTQWRKNIIEPINRFLTVMGIPEMNDQGVIQMNLFGF